jgi:hypothetical protein
MPAMASTGNQWRVSYTQTAGQGAFSGIAADSKTDAWAVGHLGTQSYITHWNGTKWMTVRLSAVTGYQLDSVVATSPGNVWIFAVNNTGNWAFHYDSAHWHKISVTDMTVRRSSAPRTCGAAVAGIRRSSFTARSPSRWPQAGDTPYTVCQYTV